MTLMVSDLPTASVQDERERAVRGDLARMALELRAAQREALAAETAAGDDEVLAQQQVVLAELQRHLEIRRQQHAVELGQARAEASLLVARARAEAAAVLAEANDECAGSFAHDVGAAFGSTVPPRPIAGWAPIADLPPLPPAPAMPLHALPAAALPTAEVPMVPAALAAAAAVPATTPQRRSFWTDVAYADVVLPLVAVLLVLTVLLAWVG